MVNCSSNQKAIQIERRYTDWPYEESVTIYEKVEESYQIRYTIQGEYNEEYYEEEYIICVNPSCYKIVMEDSWGDSWSYDSVMELYDMNTTELIKSYHMNENSKQIEYISFGESCEE